MSTKLNGPLENNNLFLNGGGIYSRSSQEVSKNKKVGRSSGGVFHEPVGEPERTSFYLYLDWMDRRGNKRSSRSLIQRGAIGHHARSPPRRDTRGRSDKRGDRRQHVRPAGIERGKT